MRAYSPATFAAIAAVMPRGSVITTREIAKLLPFDFALGTIRAVLGVMVADGRAWIVPAERADQFGSNLYLLSGNLS